MIDLTQVARAFAERDRAGDLLLMLADHGWCPSAPNSAPCPATIAFEGMLSRLREARSPWFDLTCAFVLGFDCPAQLSTDADAMRWQAWAAAEGVKLPPLVVGWHGVSTLPLLDTWLAKRCRARPPRPAVTA